MGRCAARSHCGAGLPARLGGTHSLDGQPSYSARQFIPLGDYGMILVLAVFTSKAISLQSRRSIPHVPALHCGPGLYTHFLDLRSPSWSRSDRMMVAVSYTNKTILRGKPKTPAILSLALGHRGELPRGKSHHWNRRGSSAHTILQPTSARRHGGGLCHTLRRRLTKQPAEST